MKKLILVLITVLMVTPYLTACGSSSNKKTQTSDPFTFNYTLDESNIDFFTKGDSIMTLLAAGPFYTGSQPLPFQTARDYENARTAKIAEIIKEANNLVLTVNKLEPQIAVMRSNFLSYLSIVVQGEPKLVDYAKKTTAQVAYLASQEKFVETEYKSIGSTRYDNSLVGSFMDYTKVEKSVELGDLYFQDANNILAFAAIALEATNNTSDTTVENANSQLDKDMQTADSIRKDLTSIASSIKKIKYGMNQLYTGNSYFTRSANGFMTDSLPDLKAKAAGLTPREGLTDTQIQAIRSNLSLLEKWQSQIKQYSEDSIDKSNLLSTEPNSEQRRFVLVEVAKAASASQDDYASAVDALTGSVKVSEQQEPGYFTKGWSYVKSAAHGAQTALGVTVDTASAIVANTAQIPFGLYYGNSVKDIVAEQRKNWKEVADNYKNSTSGVETLKTAGEYLDAVETTARGFVQDSGEKVTGLGNAYVFPWMAGAITQATIGMFTGLGKGLYKLGDRQADTIKIVEGSMDVGLSLIGGSKVIMKGSQAKNVVKGLAGEAEMAGKMAVNYVESTFTDSASKNLLKESAELLAKSHLTEKEAAKLISNSIQIEVKEQMIRGLATVKDRMTLEMTQILKTGGSAALAGAKETITGSLEDVFKKQFENSMKGVLDAVKTVVGTSAKDYVDNLVGGWADDLIKAQITATVESSITSAQTTVSQTPTTTTTKPTTTTTPPGTWVLINRAESRQPNNLGFTDAVFAKNSVTVTAGRSATDAAKYTGSWPEPPASIGGGQSFSGTVSVKDAGSKWDGQYTARVQLSAGYAPSGSLNLKGAWATATNVPAKPYDTPDNPTFQWMFPAAGDAMGSQIIVTAQCDMGDVGTAMRATVKYTYELRK